MWNHFLQKCPYILLKVVKFASFHPLLSNLNLVVDPVHQYQIPDLLCPYLKYFDLLHPDLLQYVRPF